MWCCFIETSNPEFAVMWAPVGQMTVKIPHLPPSLARLLPGNKLQPKGFCDPMRWKKKKKNPFSFNMKCLKLSNCGPRRENLWSVLSDKKANPAHDCVCLFPLEINKVHFNLSDSEVEMSSLLFSDRMEGDLCLLKPTFIMTLRFKCCSFLCPRRIQAILCTLKSSLCIEAGVSLYHREGGYRVAAASAVSTSLQGKLFTHLKLQILSKRW